jgi:uncharacterized protein YndB with AHSA1/START domain
MTNSSTQAATISRSVSAHHEDGQDLHVVTISQLYPTTVDDLWDACTSAERIPRWFLPISGDLRVGGRYQFEGNAGGVIEQCDRPNRVDVTWEYGEAVTWVTLSFFPTPEGGARLELVHVAPSSDHWDTYGPGAVGIGWDLGFLGLAKHLETGATIDAAAEAEWSASPEGLAFITASGNAWTEAAIASGADPAWARESGDRTIAFYTGQEPEASPES